MKHGRVCEDIMRLFSETTVEARHSGYSSSTTVSKRQEYSHVSGAIINSLESPTFAVQPQAGRLMKLFSDFWQYSVVMGFSSEEHGVWPRDWYDGVKEIAFKSPKLTFATSERSDIRLIAFNSAIAQEGVSLNELHELKQQLEPPPNIVSILNQYQFPILVYLESLHWLKLLRLRSNKQFTFHILFDYLEDNAVQKDHQGMYDCVCAIGEKLFKEFLAIMAEQPKSAARELDLENHAEILLVQFNNPNKAIQLADKFPHILWSRRVLFSSLDMLDSLASHLQLNPNIEDPVIHVGNATGQTIMLKATQSERELIVKDFAQRCKGIVKEAMRWAPYTMKSHIREYIDKRKQETNSHFGLALATEGVLTYVALNSPSYSLAQSYLAARPGQFFSSLSQRKKYSGKLLQNVTPIVTSALTSPELSLAATMALKDISRNFTFPMKLYNDTVIHSIQQYFQVT